MNAHTPFDAKKDWSNPYCQNSSNDPMVDALLGNAYHVVRTVYCNLGNLKLIYDFLNQYGMVLGVQSEAELKALTTKAKYARIYGFSRAGDRQVTDYLYVEGDRTGITPDDPEATGSWITVATSGSSSGGTYSGEGAYIPWVYSNGSATGGETSINVPDGTVGVPFIIINGDMQYVGRGFEFNADSLSVTLAQPLEEGDEVVFLLTGVPAVPDNPNVNDWVQINWLYNNGAAVGGEQVIAIPYTFQSVPAVYKNGLRLYKGLTTESYTADPDNQRILLTEPLATNDRLIVQIGGEVQVLESSDHTLQEVARATNVKDSEVILSTDTTQLLNGKKVIYSISEQKAYGLPALPSNIYINSVSNGQLTYSPGNITVDLVPVPNSGIALRADLASEDLELGDNLLTVKQPFTGSVVRTQHDKNAEMVSVKDFGAVGDGVNDDTAAFQKAFATCASIFIPAGTYKVTDLTLDKSAYGEQQVSVVHGNGAIITGNSVTLLGWRKVKASGLKFSVSEYVTLMDVRNCTFSDIDFGATRFGRWEELGRATYSIYWNKFNECRFAGMYAKTDIDSANFNSNVFDSCELRRRLDTDEAIFYFYETPNHKAVFSGTTFIGCDASYTAVFKVVDPHITWAVVWVGGFIDSGSKWFADGSNEVTTFDVVGARVPARDARPYTTPTANIGMQSGGIKNSRYIPAGSLSYLPRFKRTVAGEEIIRILSLPLPCSGEWTISANLKETGAGLESTAIANTTKGGGRTYDLIEHSGFSTTTFKADAGDVIEIIFDGKVGTATEIQSLSLTLGAGVPSAVEVNDTGRRSITNLSVGVATTIFSFTIPNYSQAAYDMQLVCKNKTGNGAGLLMKRASVLAAKTSGAARVNILEYSESSVAGDAGTSTNAGTCTLTSSVSGNTVNIMATLGNTGAAGITAAELVLIVKEI
ncbi:tail fiber protein [Escherichia phage EC1-UPM]|uniref:Tail fiber protein n=1 Tax=Escherichia phage EC1-UPM TaxID=1258572 RepID=M9PKD4_9CAUD|nr:tail protein [Escherichia phage EC1-UPM]AGC31500.1 tail fiber protein [Escherichia phage EC1-UPM]